jgi:hypothetical protein
MYSVFSLDLTLSLHNKHTGNTDTSQPDGTLNNTGGQEENTPLPPALHGTD